MDQEHGSWHLYNNVSVRAPRRVWMHTYFFLTALVKVVLLGLKWWCHKAFGRHLPCNPGRCSCSKAGNQGTFAIERVPEIYNCTCDHAPLKSVS